MHKGSFLIKHLNLCKSARLRLHIDVFIRKIGNDWFKYVYVYITYLNGSKQDFIVINSLCNTDHVLKQFHIDEPEKPKVKVLCRKTDTA